MATSKDALLEELAAIRTAKLRILGAGQSVTLPGGGPQITQASFAALCRREREIRRALLMAGGAKDCIRPAYSSDSGIDWEES